MFYRSVIKPLIKKYAVDILKYLVVWCFSVAGVGGYAGLKASTRKEET